MCVLLGHLYSRRARSSRNHFNRFLAEICDFCKGWNSGLICFRFCEIQTRRISKINDLDFQLYTYAPLNNGENFQMKSKASSSKAFSQRSSSLARLTLSKYYELPSRRIPTLRHFFSLQYWHWFRWCWSIGQDLNVKSVDNVRPFGGAINLFPRHV